jgi:hypothetical protein
MASCVFFLLLFLAPIVMWIIVAVIDEKRFNEKFPPISDAEFVARSSCTNPQIALKVRRILADCLNVEYERIYPSSTLQGDLGAE